MTDFSWTAGGELETEKVPEECKPSRFAVTAPQCIFRDSGREVLLIDPHPEGTWMSWMFPYASLVLTNQELAEGGSTEQLEGRDYTFGELANFLRNIRTSREGQYRESIKNEVNNVLPDIGEGWTHEPFFENYSLKFSKTSNSFTAYVFEYHRSQQDETMRIDCPHLWVPVAGALQWLDKPENLVGRNVSSNVIDLFSSPLFDG